MTIALKEKKQKLRPGQTLILIFDSMLADFLLQSVIYSIWYIYMYMPNISIQYSFFLTSGRKGHAAPLKSSHSNIFLLRSHIFRLLAMKKIISNA